MSILEQFNELKGKIREAKLWEKHLSAIGRMDETADVRIQDLNIDICIQYQASGKNYWEIPNEKFKTYLKNRISYNIKTIIKDAIGDMEAGLEKLKAEASKEYRELFSSELITE